MVLIVEAVDCCGKDTQIELIKKEAERHGWFVHNLHYSNVSPADSVEEYSKLYYKDIFETIRNMDDIPGNLIISNRLHLGEDVYSPLYRNYSGEYVFKYEDIIPNAKLILFTDDAEKIIERDIARNDGKSFTLDLDKKKKELELFDKAFEKSNFKKIRIPLNGRTPEEIFNQDVKNFVFGV